MKELSVGTDKWNEKFAFFTMMAGLFILLSGCATTRHGDLDGDAAIPPVPREFRAAWIATVANINWPGEPGLSSEKQQQEAIELLDLLVAHNYNAVIFQVRPQADALYSSTLEPWSYYLTGKQGQRPEPYYDPLQFWIEEAHKRGLELHAWLNPYRAHHVQGGPVTDASLVKKYPELVVALENGYWWFDPTQKATRDHSHAVVMDIVRRYNIDGIHFDDYFYPYPSYNNNKDFPDEKSWKEYQLKGGRLSRGDWRRDAVNLFIERVYKSIKKEKKHVKFGLSPFGIWRPGNPRSIKGFDQYEKLYADARLWLQKGWIDYWTPQLYWPINQIPQSYPVLLGWWKDENSKNRHIWPGMSIGRLSGEKGADEVVNQIMVTRGMLPENTGSVHWSIAPLIENPVLAEALIQGPYKKQALVPASPWLDNTRPEAPEVEILKRGNDLEISWKHKRPVDAFRSVVYYEQGAKWDYAILNQGETSFSLPSFMKVRGFGKLQETATSAAELFEPISRIKVTAIDRVGNESISPMHPVPAPDFTGLPALSAIRAETALKNSSKNVAGTRRSHVRLGSEVLVEEQLSLLRGKRVGLITNPSAVGSDLKSDIDLLANTPGVNLVALFGAEHGVRGARQGRIKREGEPDPATGIPVYSLYGDSFAPKQEWLKKIDVLLFSIQGVGSAWYTFKYSMSFAMEACARAGIPFVVLDRPNPLGGDVVEGPLLNLASIFRHQLPLRHGMTYGELATMWNDTEKFGTDLTVIKMKGWQRSMLWDETGLPWVMPSPNMGTFETALVYPGQCLFERSNMSEARGTTKPFLLTGAPWVNPEAAAADLNSRGIPGAQFRPAWFLPRKATPGANPRGKPWNRMNGGVEIMLTDYKAYRSVEAALHMIDAFRKTNPDSLQWSPPPMLKKLENPDTTIADIIAASKKEIEAFMAVREKYLLYK